MLNCYVSSIEKKEDRYFSLSRRHAEYKTLEGLIVEQMYVFSGLSEYNN